MRARLRVRLVLVAGLALLLAPGTALAATLKEELLRDWQEMKDTMVKLAEAMPADKYDFKTTPPQRTYAEQVLHIATANVLNLNYLKGKTTPPVIDRTVRDKVDVVRAMNASFDYGTALISEQTEQSLMETVDAGRFLGPSSRARVVWFLLGHTWDIYGQMVVYLRLNGGVPPASQRP